jgi:hypothetical protein
MKILNDKEIEVASDEPYTIVYSLAAVRNITTTADDADLYVPTMQFGAKSKDEIRKLLHEDIDRFVDAL